MAEPDIATSVDEEQNSGIIDTVAQNIAEIPEAAAQGLVKAVACLLYTSPSPRDRG